MVAIAEAHPKVLHYYYRLWHLQRQYEKLEADAVQACHAFNSLKAHWKQVHEKMPKAVRVEAGEVIMKAIKDRDKVHKQMEDMCKAFTGSTKALSEHVKNTRRLSIKALDAYEARLRELGIDPNSTPEPDA